MMTMVMILIDDNNNIKCNSMANNHTSEELYYINAWNLKSDSSCKIIEAAVVGMTSSKIICYSSN